MKEISLLRLSLAIYIDMFLRLVTTFINTYMISRVDRHRVLQPRSRILLYPNRVLRGRVLRVPRPPRSP